MKPSFKDSIKSLYAFEICSMRTIKLCHMGQICIAKEYHGLGILKNFTFYKEEFSTFDCLITEVASINTIIRRISCCLEP
jgi:hypothetical protein